MRPALFAIVCIIALLSSIAHANPLINKENDNKVVLRSRRQLEQQDNPQHDTTTTPTISPANDKESKAIDPPQPNQANAEDKSNEPLYPQLNPHHHGPYPHQGEIFVPPAFHPANIPPPSWQPVQPGGAFIGSQFPMSHTDPHTGQPIVPQPPPPPPPPPPHQPPQQGRFINNLGRRFMTLFNIGALNRTTTAPSNDQTDSRIAQLTPEQQQALGNATLLAQLNKGMHSMFSNLSKMWNSTVQQQLDTLQDRFKSETNSTGEQPISFQQRIAKQVPEVFKSMAQRVNEAQESLNRLWRQVSNSTANVTELESQLKQAQSQQQQVPPGGSFFKFGDPNESFYTQIQRSLGFEPHHEHSPHIDIGVAGIGLPDDREQPKQSFSAMLTQFWHNQVNPQMQRIQGKLSNVWQDLTRTRALTDSQPTYGGGYPGAPTLRRSQSTTDAQPPSSEAIDQLLNSIDVNNPEYTLIGNEGNDSSVGSNNKQEQQISNKIQASVINMQRQLNGLWQSLTNSLQSAITNSKQIVNPQPPVPMAGPPMLFVGPDGVRRVHVGQVMSVPPSDKSDKDLEKEKEIQASDNELAGKIKEMERLQRDADSVYQVIQDQQARSQSVGDRFKHFFHNIQVPDTFTRFGHGVNDFWNTIPTRWDQFVTNLPIGPNSPGAGQGRRNSTSGSSTTAAPSSGTQANTPTESPSGTPSTVSGSIDRVVSEAAAAVASEFESAATEPASSSTTAASAGDSDASTN